MIKRLLDGEMAITRRWMMVSAFGLAACSNLITQSDNGEKWVYGLLGNIIAKPGRGPELAQILLRGSRSLRGNLQYLVSVDSENSDSVWIYEVWDDAQAHQASLQTEQVQTAIAEGRPLIERFDSQKKLVAMNA